MASGTKKTYEEIEELFKSKGLILITKEYRTTRTKMEYICEYGHTGETTPRSISEQGTGCRECSKEKLSKMHRLPYSHVEKDFAKEGYKLLTKNYRNSDQKLLYMCDNGHIEEMNYSNFQCGKRCPSCKQSKGEKQVQIYLEKNNLVYIRQVRFEECRSKRPLPFDFGIYDREKLVCLIEYQGIQHYQPIDFAGRGEDWAIKEFEGVIERDGIKESFCHTRNIPLIKIHYSLKGRDIDTYLNNELEKLKININKKELSA